MYHGFANPFRYRQDVSMPMFLSLVSQYAPSDHLDQLFHNFSIHCKCICNDKWLSSFKQAFSIHCEGGSLCRDYNLYLNQVLDWCVYQRNNKHKLEKEKQALLGLIRI